MISFIETYSGVRFQPLSPRAADVRMIDIAHALSNLCRFTGHVRYFYSVGQHSVLVSQCLAYLGQPKSVQFWGLMHDAGEAYVGDLASPTKSHPDFGFFRGAETAVMNAVCERFGMVREEPSAVKEADLILLATEARDLMPYRPEHWGSLTRAPLPGRIEPWTPVEAKHRFIQRFEELL